MPSSPKIDQALASLHRTVAAERMPHALLVCGHPRASGYEFVLGLLELLFPGRPRTSFGGHPDVRWIEPEGKARQIKVDECRNLTQFIGLTSYEGGWKAGVVLFADRMNEHAQNALLKTLEEPPQRSLLVMVTDVPAAMLATIRSRSQYVDVLDSRENETAVWRADVLDLLRNPPSRRACDLLAWSDRLTAPLRELEDLARTEESQKLESANDDTKGDAEFTKAAKEVVEGRVASRVKEMREEFLRTLQLWQRDVLARVQNAETHPANFPDDAAYIQEQAERLSFADALSRVAAIDQIRELLEHHVRPSVAFPRLARAISKPEDR